MLETLIFFGGGGGGMVDTVLKARTSTKVALDQFWTQCHIWFEFIGSPL